MSAAADFHDWRPAPAQELLLKASLLHGEVARRALAEWSRATDLGRVDPGSARLLPLLYHRLKLDGVDDLLAGQLRRFYNDAWAKNQVILAKAAALLPRLLEAGIPTLVLKGLSLTVRYYRDPGLRPMSDFDILVRTPQALEALELLAQLDWVPEPGARESIHRFMSVNHAVRMHDSAGCELDLHWHMLSECLAPDADADFWAAAVPFRVKGAGALGLDPADELFHICIHGVRWNKLPPIRWVADALTLLGSSDALEWGRLLEQAAKRRLSLPLTAALHYLKDEFGAPVPDETLEALSRIPVTKTELLESRARMDRPGWTFSTPPYLWVYYPRISRDTGRPPGLLGFLDYLQALWGLDHLWQVPLHAALDYVKRVFGLPAE